MAESFEAVLKRIEDRSAKTQAYMNTQVQEIPCEIDGTLRKINGADHKMDGETYVFTAPRYEECATCVQKREIAERRKQKIRHAITVAGIPHILAESSFSNLTYETESDRENAKLAEEWSKEPVGFLLLLGGVGTSKSHIAAAIVNKTQGGRFVGQSDLLSKLRMTYRDRDADAEFLEAYKDAPLLALDELGVSSGGRDEYPLIHELLGSRYERYLPTVITSNLDVEEFRSVVGDRIADRIRQAMAEVGVLRFCEKSKRSGLNSAYLEEARKAGATRQLKKGVPESQYLM